jgi:hypothetical protein
MINNTKIAKFGFAAFAAIALCACGAKTTTSSAAPASSVAPVSSAAPASSAEDYNFSQNSTSVTETMWNLQITGSAYGWAPDKAAGNAAVHFTRVSKMLWTLSNISVAVDEEFKFTFNDGWNNDFGWKGCYNTVTDTIKEYVGPADSTKKFVSGEDSNIKVAKAAVLDFEFHPFYVAEAGLQNKLVIKLHA